MQLMIDLDTHDVMVMFVHLTDRLDGMVKERLKLEKSLSKRPSFKKLQLLAALRDKEKEVVNLIIKVNAQVQAQTKKAHLKVV